MTRPQLFALAAITLFIPSFSQAETVTISGCVEQGVEPGCLVIQSAGKTYNVSSARPRPAPGMYGTITGTVFDGPTTCMQGTPLSPATWEEDVRMHCRKKVPQ